MGWPTGKLGGVYDREAARGLLFLGSAGEVGRLLSMLKVVWEGVCWGHLISSTLRTRGTQVLYHLRC